MDADAPDASPPPGRLLRILPSWAEPYARLARLDRPIGTWLLLWPCWCGIVLAGPAAGRRWPDLGLMALFALGAVVMRSAGCTYNDIVDRDIDARVARTRTRPVASGEISVLRAWLFLVALSLIGLGVLLCLNRATFQLGIASLALVAIYPFMKRVTYWPQAFLGLTFNWGALMGYAAVTGRLGLPALFLYAAGIAWTLGYDTIYAHQDKEDDALIGVKSTALRFGARTRAWLLVFYALALGFLAAAIATAGLGGMAYWWLAALGLHFVYQIVALDIDDPERCLKLFKANRDAGALIFAALLAGALTAEIVAPSVPTRAPEIAT